MPIKPLPIEETPIKVINPTPEPEPKPIVKKEPIIEEPTKPIEDIIPTPSYGGGGGGGGYTGGGYEDGRGGLGREPYLYEINQRENIQ